MSRPPGELQHGPGVPLDLAGVDVAADAGDRDQLGLGRGGRVEQGEAVVDPGVDVEDERGSSSCPDGTAGASHPAG